MSFSTSFPAREALSDGSTGAVRSDAGDTGTRLPAATPRRRASWLPGARSGTGRGRHRARHRLSPRPGDTKHLLDVALIAISLPILLLTGLAIALAICVSDGRPVFFAQRRIGLGGKPFRCWKFRTMVRDADRRLERALSEDPALKAEWRLNRKLRHDPRISRIGQFLRKTSLDELPQLWNVLCGDMSLVGPRPVIEEELILYGSFAQHYTAVRPGLTGMWQVSGRSTTTYRRRVALDVYYVRNASLLLDAKILYLTVVTLASGRGAY